MEDIIVVEGLHDEIKIKSKGQAKKGKKFDDEILHQKAEKFRKTHKKI